MAVLTANHCVRGSYATTEQGVQITPETDLYILNHPPFITIVNDAAGHLEGLTPPKSLIEDWNREIPNNSIPDTWETVKYEERYREFLETDENAKSDLFKINMLSQVKNVCLVCSCTQWEYCIRRVIYEYLTEDKLPEPGEIFS